MIALTKLNRRRQVVQAVFRMERGRFVYRNLAMFAEMHLSAGVESLPDWASAGIRRTAR